MSLKRKLKPDRNITGPVISLSALVIFGLGALIFGLRGVLFVLAFLIWAFALFSLIVFLRTRNIPYLIASAYQVFLGSMAYLLPSYVGTSRVEPIEYRLAYMSGFIFFGVLLIYFVATRKIKWRGREIFELAGENVVETGDGYTPRPRPVGKVEFSPQQMPDFALFTARHLIALPYHTSKSITLVPIKMGDEFGRVLGLSGDFRDDSWVKFDVDGDVSVHIAQKDYLDYTESLDFDQLCTSFGQVFLDFFELYKKGEGVRVIDRLDNLQIAVFS